MFATSINRKTIIALIATVLGIFIIVISNWLSNNFFQSLFLNSAFLLVGLGIGIFIINFYLELDKQKKIIYAAFLTIEYSFHNTRRKILKIIYTKYGVDEFVKIYKHYLEHKGRYAFLSVKDRKAIYEIVNENYEELKELFDTLSKNIKEIIPIVGAMEININFLELLLSFQHDTNYFLNLDLGKEDSQEDAVVVFLNCTIGSYIIHRKFLKANNDDFPEEPFAWDLPELIFPKSN